MTLRYLAALLALVAIALLVTVLAFNQGFLKNRCLAWASDQLGRRVAIDGDFELQVGAVVRIAANRVRVANTAWGSQPEMLVAQRVLLELDLLSLLRDTVIIPRIEVAGLTVLLERTAGGLNNWDFDEAEETRDRQARWIEAPALVVKRVSLPGARLRFIGPRLTRPLVMEFDSIEQQLAPGGMLALSVAGQANAVPIHIDASVGPEANLLRGEKFGFKLDGSIGELTLAGEGHIDDMGAPANTALSFTLSGPDAEYVTRYFGVRDLGSGPIKLDARIVKAADHRGISGTLSGVFGAFTLGASGELADPANLEKLVVQLQTAGPDLSLLGGLLGINQLPAEVFTLETHIERNGDALTIDATTLRLSDAELQLHGSLSGVERFTGSDLSFAIKGFDLEWHLLKLKAPDSSFRHTGEGRYPANCRKYWIPPRLSPGDEYCFAPAGMTIGLRYSLSKCHSGQTTVSVRYCLVACCLQSYPTSRWWRIASTVTVSPVGSYSYNAR